jgi:hypothetical protein
MDTQDVDANGNPKSLLDQIPQWLTSLHQMENELRKAAQKGLLLRRTRRWIISHVATETFESCRLS